jgi:HEPN domain-containing protein
MMAEEFPSALGLRKLAQDRLEDANALLAAGRYHGAVYLSGYALEFALKARICNYLGWKEFDEKSLQKHELEFLLRFTGLENSKELFLTQWSIVSEWNPRMRYNTSDEFQEQQARRFVEATEQLIKKIII